MPASMADDGEIKIELMRAGSWVNCRVTDNGSGLGRIKPGRGLRIVGELAKSLGGRIDHAFGTTWNSFALDFPLTQREQRANRTVAARRPRTSRRLKATPSLPLARRGRAGESDRRPTTALDRRTHTMSKKTLLTLSASVLLGAATRRAKCRARAVRPSSGSSAHARWSSSGPRCRWSSSGSRRRSSTRWSSGRTCRWSPPRGARTSARSCRWSRSDGPAGLHGFDRGGSASFRGVEARAAAYTASQR